MKGFILAAVAALALSSSAHAQSDVPLFSADRLSAGVTANYALYQQAGDQPLPNFTKSWEFGAVAAYNLVSRPDGSAPLFSLTYSLNYDVDNRWWRHRIGGTLVLYKGGR